MAAVSAMTNSRATPRGRPPTKRAAAAKRAPAAKRAAPAKRASSKVPPKKAMPANPAPYLVRPGQTWEDIGKLHDLSADQVQALNPGSDTPKAGSRVKVKF